MGSRMGLIQLLVSLIFFFKCCLPAFFFFYHKYYFHKFQEKFELLITSAYFRFPHMRREVQFIKSEGKKLVAKKKINCLKLHFALDLSLDFISVSAYHEIYVLKWQAHNKGNPNRLVFSKCCFIFLHTKDTFMTLPEQSRRIHSICCIDKVDVWSESRARRTTSATTYKFNNEYASHIFSQRFSFFPALCVCKDGCSSLFKDRAD